MNYLGSKRSYAKELLPIILKNRRPGQYYVEPFAGGFNMIDKVDGPRIANDINTYLTSLFTALQLGWQPPSELSEAEYYDIKTNKDDYPDHVVGFVGFTCAYGGKWFDVYARDAEGSNYCLRGRTSVLKQVSALKGLKIENKSYKDLYVPPRSIIYCDPPYEGTTSYSGTEKFNHAEFWDWVRKKTIEGNEVFVSEYSAPKDFLCLWSKKTSTNFSSQRIKSSERTENLFVYEPLLT